MASGEKGDIQQNNVSVEQMERKRVGNLVRKVLVNSIREMKQLLEGVNGSREGFFSLNRNYYSKFLY